MMKKAAIALALLILLLGGALFWLHHSLNHLVKNAIETYGSQMTKAKVTVSSVAMTTTTGTGIIQGLVVGNPKGFKTPYALKVGRIEVALDLSTLTHPAIVIKRIIIDSPDVIYEKSGGTTNFDALLRNVSRQTPSGGQSAPPQKTTQTGKKLIVALLVVRNAKAQASAGFMGGRTVSVSLPDITLRHIGQSEGGVLPKDLGAKIGEALKAKLQRAISFSALANSFGHSLKNAGHAISRFFGQ
ncbi:MAG: hypothetical protein ACP5OP_09075 [Leptospirillia bacterium]